MLCAVSNKSWKQHFTRKQLYSRLPPISLGWSVRYSCSLVGCCFHNLFKTARSILVQLPSSLFSRRLVRVQMVQPYSSTDITTSWNNCRFNLLLISDFHMTDNLFVADHAFAIRVLTSLFVDEILLPRYVNCSTILRRLPSSVEISPFFLKLMNSVLSESTWWPMFRAVFSGLSSRYSASASVFARSSA